MPLTSTLPRPRCPPARLQVGPPAAQQRGPPHVCLQKPGGGRERAVLLQGWRAAGRGARRGLRAHTGRTGPVRRALRAQHHRRDPQDEHVRDRRRAGRGRCEPPGAAVRVPAVQAHQALGVCG